MSEFTDTWAEFLETITITKVTGSSNTGGIVNKTTTTVTIDAIIQPSEESRSINSQMLDRSLDGKNEKGSLLVLTDEILNKDDTFIYDNFKYRIDQKANITKILPHYEYVALLTKVQ